MTLPGWQYPEGHLSHVVAQQEDPEWVFASTLGIHGYQTARVLFSYMPKIFTEDPYLRDLLWAMAIELDAVRAALDRIVGARFVDFSPEWGLRLWERFAGLLEAPGGLTTGQRRALVKQAINIGAVTVPDFQEMVADFVDVPPSAVVISEDFANYSVEITIQAALTDDQAEALEHQVRRFLPAHLAVTFVYGGFIVGVNLVGDTV